MGILIVVGGLSIASGGDWGIFLDVPSLLWLAGMLIGVLWMSFGPRAVIQAVLAVTPWGPSPDRDRCAGILLVFARAYQVAWGAGIIGMLIGDIIMLQNMADPAQIGPGLAVSLLPLVYGACLAEFILAPCQQVIATRAGCTAANLPLLVVPHRSIQGVALASALLVLVSLLVLIVALHG